MPKDDQFCRRTFWYALGAFIAGLVLQKPKAHAKYFIVPNPSGKLPMPKKLVKFEWSAAPGGPVRLGRIELYRWNRFIRDMRTTIERVG